MKQWIMVPLSITILSAQSPDDSRIIKNSVDAGMEKIFGPSGVGIIGFANMIGGLYPMLVENYSRNTLLVCIGSDVFGCTMDKAMSAQLKTPPNPFFNEFEFRKRVAQLKSANPDKAREIDQVVDLCKIEVGKALIEKAKERAGNSIDNLDNAKVEQYANQACETLMKSGWEGLQAKLVQSYAQLENSYTPELFTECIINEIIGGWCGKSLSEEWPRMRPGKNWSPGPFWTVQEFQKRVVPISSKNSIDMPHLNKIIAAGEKICPVYGARVVEAYKGALNAAQP